MSVHVNAEYAHEMTPRERLRSRPILVERIGWNKKNSHHRGSDASVQEELQLITT